MRAECGVLRAVPHLPKPGRYGAPPELFESGSEKCRSIRLASELLVAPKAGATNSDASLRMTLLFNDGIVVMWRKRALRAFSGLKIETPGHQDWFKNLTPR